MPDFYLASTPYHLLLALADAERRDRPTTIYLFGNFPSAALYLAALRRGLRALPLLRAEGMIGGYGDPVALHRALGAMGPLLDEVDPQRVYVFNDHHDLSQYVLGWARRRGRFRGCIEDGSSFYTDWRVCDRVRPTRQLRKRLSVSPAWTSICIPGTHPALQQLRVLRPELVRPELRSRAEPLDLDLLHSPVVAELAAQLLGDLRITPPEQCPDCLVAPSPESRLPWRAMLKDLVGANATLAYKYHPRELRGDPLHLAGCGAELPRDLPLELIYARWQAVPRRVIGSAGSTVLLTSRLFSPEAQVTGYYHGTPPSQVARYRSAGIELKAA